MLAAGVVVGAQKWGPTGGGKKEKKEREQGAGRSPRLAGVEWHDEPVLLKAGQVSFHHALTFHGSGPNVSTEPRLCVISHMMPGDTVYKAGRPQHPNLALLGPNAYDRQPFNSDFFPQLWPVEARTAVLPYLDQSR